jgi:hypothetical protein
MRLYSRRDKERALVRLPQRMLWRVVGGRLLLSGIVKRARRCPMYSRRVRLRQRRTTGGGNGNTVNEQQRSGRGRFLWHCAGGERRGCLSCPDSLALALARHGDVMASRSGGRHTCGGGCGGARRNRAQPTSAREAPVAAHAAPPAPPATPPAPSLTCFPFLRIPSCGCVRPPAQRRR